MPRRAQPVRGVPADDGAVGSGADQAARKVDRRDAGEPAGRGHAQLRAGAVAAGHSRPRRRPRADPAGRPAHGRPVEPVRRSRRDRSIRPPRSGSRSCAVRPRCSTAPMRSAAWSTSSPTTSRRGRSMGATGNCHVRCRIGRHGSGRRPATCTSATARFALHAGGGGRRSGDVETPARRGRQLAVAQRLRQRRRWPGPGPRAISAAATATTTRSTAFRSSRSGSIQLTPRRHAFSLRGGAQSGRRRVRLVPRHAGGAALQARRARGHGGRHGVHATTPTRSR